MRAYIIIKCQLNIARIIADIHHFLWKKKREQNSIIEPFVDLIENSANIHGEIVGHKIN